MRPLRESFHDFWFTPAPAKRLGMLRIILGAFICLWMWSELSDFIKVPYTDPRLFAPVGVVFHGPIAADLFPWAVYATFGLAILFTLGLWHRVTGPLFAGMFLWLLCYRQSWSMIYHSDDVVVLHAIVLGVARSADALSLDAYFRKRRSPASNFSDQVSWQYNWPVKLMCSLVVCSYFLAAVAKLAGPLGLSWMTGENLRAQMAVDGIRKELLGKDPNPFSYAIYDKVLLFTVLSAGSLITELFAPLALFNKRVGWLWSINAFFMHWGILAVMHITFHYQLSGVMYMAFFPVERILDLWYGRAPDAKRRARVLAPAAEVDPVLQPVGQHATLYYDGECGLCDRFVQFVLRRDHSEYFQFATLQSEGGRRQLATLDMSGTDLKTIMLVEGDERYTRSTAALRICRRLAAPWPLLYGFMVIPKPLRDGVYSFVAARRKRWFPPPAECPVMPPELRRRFLS